MPSVCLVGSRHKRADFYPKMPAIHTHAVGIRALLPRLTTLLKETVFICAYS